VDNILCTTSSQFYLPSWPADLPLTSSLLVRPRQARLRVVNVKERSASYHSFGLLSGLCILPLLFFGHNVSSVCLSVTFCIVAENCLNEQIGNHGKKFIFGSPPYFYILFRLYGHQDGRFCLIFARRAQRSVLDGTNGLSSSKPCT